MKGDLNFMVRNINTDEGKRLAEEHWKWLETWIHLIYVDAFVHGYGHGYEDAEKET